MQPENDLITIQVHKEITHLYKTFLELLEDVRNQHNIMLQKVEKSVGPEITEQVNFFTVEYYDQLRKRVLDNGNDCQRQLLSFLDFFNFQIDAKKVETIASSKKVIKKFVTSQPIEIP